MRLDGFGIMVEDMATMIRFYRDVLGFEIKENEGPAMCFLKRMAPYSYCMEEKISRQ